MRLSKWHALGNDYLLVEPGEAPAALTADFVRRVCDYHRGVGSDGLLEVVAADGRAADVRIWNPDGSEAEFSGNGARIVAAWLSGRSGSNEVVVRVGAREARAEIEGAEVILDVGRVEVGRSETIGAAGEQVEVTPVSVGNPHAVVRGDPDEIDRLGPEIERHPRFPERTNVQLVRVDGRHDLTVRVWERGVGETLSSGTSSVAAAAAAVTHGWCATPVVVHLPGGDLRVELDDERNARLTGPAEKICTVELDETFL